MNITPIKSISLDDKLKEGKLSPKYFEALKKIPANHFWLPWNNLPPTREAIAELVEYAREGSNLHLGEYDFVNGSSPLRNFKPKQRLLTSIAIAIVQDGSEYLGSTKQAIIVAGNNFFTERTAAKKYATKNTWDGDVGYCFDDRFTLIEMMSGNKIRACNTRCLNAPDDFYGHVQLMTKKGKITTDIQYIDFRSD